MILRRGPHDRSVGGHRAWNGQTGGKEISDGGEAGDRADAGEGNARYGPLPGAGPDEDPKVGTLYVKKAASKRLGNPTRIRVTIEAIDS